MHQLEDVPYSQLMVGDTVIEGGSRFRLIGVLEETELEEVVGIVFDNPLIASTFGEAIANKRLNEGQAVMSQTEMLAEVKDALRSKLAAKFYHFSTEYLGAWASEQETVPAFLRGKWIVKWRSESMQRLVRTN